MPGGQRTFELVPTTLVRTDGPRRAMTSKAAKKAYQQRNRGPKVSKAEQRRLEAEEIARQKKEYESQRAATKAKAARDKKAAKEQAEKAMRKKMGLPEPSKFVRPSQPTISRFVKSGNKRTWQEMEAVAEDSEGTLEGQEDAVVANIEDEDEFGDFPSLSQSDIPDLLEKIDSSLNKQESLDGGDDVQVLPARQIQVAEDEDECTLADMATTQLLSEAAEAANRISSPVSAKITDMEDMTEAHHLTSIVLQAIHSSPKQSTIFPPVLGDRSVEKPFQDEQIHKILPSLVKKDIEKAHITSSMINQQTSRITRKVLTSPNSPSVPEYLRPALQNRSINMPPPCGPIDRGVKSRSIVTCTPTVKTATKLVRSTKPPSATQAFLEDHLNDFFPSPSQQVRELLDDIDDIPSNTQVAKELSPYQHSDNDPFAISTQDLILSPQDLLEITTPSRALDFRGQNPALQRSVSSEKRRFFEEKEEDIVVAAVHKSRVVEVEKQHGISTENFPVRSSRTLQRIQSTFTDYGDEEFNEQELLALC